MAEVKQFARLIIDEYKTAKTVDISPRWKLEKVHDFESTITWTMNV